MKIIDVSYHNGKIDFAKVKADGIDGVIIRAGYGSGNIDKKFKEYIAACNKIGLPVGVYWFSYAYSVGMARKEAEYCIDAIKPYKVDFPVFFDWEYDSMRYAKTRGVAPNKKLITQMNKAFCQAVKSAGYKAGFYFNLDYAKNLITVADVGNYVTWFARYTSAAGRDCDLWQYSSSGHVDGISGHVDMNKVINKRLFAVDNVDKSDNEVKKKKSNKEIAAEVVAGKWGNGEDRKKKLKEAGYDYEAIQKIVNDPVYYTVKKGDKLSGIADKYKTTVAAIKKLNKDIKDVNKIYTGQKIRVK